MENNLQETLKEWHGTYRAYTIGFICSFLLTLASFGLVAYKLLPPDTLIYTVLLLALIQAIVQLRFFLHLGEEPKPRWETFIFFFMLLILFIIVIGSLWIMHDLNERTMKTVMEHVHD